MINRARRSALRHYANGFYSTAPALLVYHKAELMQKGTFSLIHLFARDVLKVN